MKYNIIIVLLIFISSLLTAQQLGNKSKLNKNAAGNCLQTIDSIKYDLSTQEKDGLIYMRLEEKLARDVYLTLGKTYTQRMFINIPESEQRHMNAVKTLLDKYAIPDPVEKDEIGVFNNKDFQKLYNDLVAKGIVSFNEAMLVGKAIEELDIKDLNERLEQTDNPDIKIIYENLKQASENHLRAFTNHL